MGIEKHDEWYLYGIIAAPLYIHWIHCFQDVAISLNPEIMSLLKNSKWRILWVLKLKDPSKFQFKTPLQHTSTRE